MLVLAAALLLGGGTMQGLPGDAIVIALGLLLAVLLVAAWPAHLLRDHRAECILLLAVLLLPLLQLLPLPPALWTALPGRAALAADQASVGIAPHWAPLSLDPAGTWRAWLAMLPAATLFVAALTLSPRALQHLTLLIPLLALAGALLGFAQVAGGPDSPLRLFAYTQRTSAEGFFANRDHFADLLNIGMLLSAAWLIALWLQPGARAARRALTMAAAWVTLASLLVALLLTQSRAGVALGALTLAAIVVLAWRAGQAKPRLARRMALALLVIAMLALQWGLYAVLARLHQDPFEDARWWIMRTTWIAAQHYGWLGSGIGSFVHVLPQFQARATLIPPYVNHAHNDYLEL
ncbi:membrane protein, partial [mine drainage metagenome]